MIVLQVSPNNYHFVWQTQIWIENLKKHGLDTKAYVIIYLGKNKNLIPHWYKMANEYNKVRFYVYHDEEGYVKPEHRALYIPIMRFYCLKRFYEENKRIVDRFPVFYCDSDILLLDNFNVNSLLNDNVFYLSDTRSYIGASYFDSKIKDVLEDKIEEYKKIDVLDEACKIVGINRQIAMENESSSGGAQYILKPLDSDFWNKCYYDCINIRSYLVHINKEFFGSESRGFQSWTSDMWSLLWNLWYFNKPTKIDRRLDFCMATSPYDCLKTASIYHNAGSNINLPSDKFFFKRLYIDRNPFEDDLVEKMYNDETTRKYACWAYVKFIVELKKDKNFKII